MSNIKLLWNMTPDELKYETHKLINDSKKINKELINYKFTDKNSVMNFIGKLSDDITKMEIYHSVCGFLQYVFPNENNIKLYYQIDQIITKYNNELNLNKQLYDQLIKLQNIMDKLKINNIDKQFIYRIIRSYEKNGISLPEEKKTIVIKLKQEIYKLENHISKYIHQHEHDKININIDNLKGMPQSIIDELCSKSKSNKENIELTLDKLTYFLCMKYINNSKVRENINVIFASRYNNIIKKITQLLILKTKHAKILGHESYFDFMIQDQMMNDPNNVKKFLYDFSHKLNSRYDKEFNTVKKLSKMDSIHISDVDYYIELWKNKYCVDYDEIRNYFEMYTTVEKIFNIYSQIFNVKFRRIKNKNVWESSVMTYEVINFREVTIGYVYLDIISRKLKNNQTRCFCIQPNCLYPLLSRNYQIPVVALVSSISKIINDGPILLYFNEVITLFHEIGHIIHYLFGKSRYFMFSGFNVEEDFVEIPAQTLELICWEEKIIKELSSHHITGEKLNDYNIKKLIKIKNIDIGIRYKKNIVNALFQYYIFLDKNFVTPCENILKSKQEDKLNVLFNGLYTHLNKEIFGSTIEVNDNLILPYDLINTFDFNSPIHLPIWNRVISSEIYFDKFKNKTLDYKVGKEFIDLILKHGGERRPYELICTYLNKKPLLNGFSKLYNLDPDNKENSFFIKSDMNENNHHHSNTNIRSNKNIGNTRSTGNICNTCSQNSPNSSNSPSGDTKKKIHDDFHEEEKGIPFKNIQQLDHNLHQEIKQETSLDRFNSAIQEFEQNEESEIDTATNKFSEIF